VPVVFGLLFVATKVVTTITCSRPISKLPGLAHNRKAQCQSGREDLFFHENSHLYPTSSKLTEPLQDTHTVLVVRSSGVMLGLPYNRPRSYACGFNKRRFHWVGSSNYQDEFELLFRRSVQMTGDEYFLASHAEVDARWTSKVATALIIQHLCSSSSISP
jgi:hypothetical protein